MYHEGMRELQDHFDSRRIADRLNQVTAHNVFSETDRSFVEQSSFFFLATDRRMCKEIIRINQTT